MRGIIENRCKCSQTRVFLWHKSEYVDFTLCFAAVPPSPSNRNPCTEQGMFLLPSPSSWSSGWREWVSGPKALPEGTKENFESQMEEQKQGWTANRAWQLHWNDPGPEVRSLHTCLARHCSWYPCFEAKTLSPYLGASCVLVFCVFLWHLRWLVYVAKAAMSLHPTCHTIEIFLILRKTVSWARTKKKKKKHGMCNHHILEMGAQRGIFHEK